MEHSLETNLMNLLDDLTVMDGGKRHPSKPAAKATRAHGSMHAQLEKTLLQAAVSTAAAKKARLSTEVTAALGVLYWFGSDGVHLQNHRATTSAIVRMRVFYAEALDIRDFSNHIRWASWWIGGYCLW